MRNPLKKLTILAILIRFVYAFDSRDRYYIETQDQKYLRLALVGKHFYFLMPRIIEEKKYPDKAKFSSRFTHIDKNSTYSITYSDKAKMRGKSIINNNGDLVRLTDWELKGKDLVFKIMSSNFCGSVGDFNPEIEGYSFVITNCKDTPKQKFIIRKSIQKANKKKEVKTKSAKKSNPIFFGEQDSKSRSTRYLIKKLPA